MKRSIKHLIKKLFDASSHQKRPSPQTMPTNPTPRPKPANYTSQHAVPTNSGTSTNIKAGEAWTDRDIEVVTESAQRIVDVINESMKLAAYSHVAETRVSRLNVAKEKLEELKKMSKEYPFLKLESLPEVENNIAELELEFVEKKYKEAADGNERGQELEKEGKIDEALEVYESLLQEAVDTPFTYRRLAILYKKRKDLENEKRVLKAAIKNVPSTNSKHYSWFAERLAKRS